MQRSLYLVPVIYAIWTNSPGLHMRKNVRFHNLYRIKFGHIFLSETKYIASVLYFHSNLLAFVLMGSAS